MSKRKNGSGVVTAADNDHILDSRDAESRRNSRLFMLGGLIFIGMITLGVFASNGWLPEKGRGWFGKPLATNAGSSWNPFAAPLPTPTPALAREYVYAGSRLLSSIDANAQETPPADLAVWRPSTGGWWVMAGDWSASVTQSWGTNGDDPVEGDYS